MAELGQTERKHARSDARAAARHHRLVEIDASLLEQPLQLGRRLERAVLVEELAEWHVVGAGNVTRAESCARFWRLSGKPLRRARIDDLGGLILQQRLHVCEIAHKL